MKSTASHILTVNGGSSSIKFALFDSGNKLEKVLNGLIDRIGQQDASFRVKGMNSADTFSRVEKAPDHKAAVGILMDWIEQRIEHKAVVAVGASRMTSRIL